MITTIRIINDKDDGIIINRSLIKIIKVKDL